MKRTAWRTGQKPKNWGLSYGLKVLAVAWAGGAGAYTHTSENVFVRVVPKSLTPVKIVNWPHEHLPFDSGH